MTITDPRLAQIATNLEEQRQWITRVTWDTIKVDHAIDEDDKHNQEIRILGIAEQLLQEVYHLVKLVEGK